MRRAVGMPPPHVAGNEPPAASSRCARCGAPFHCGRDDPGGCWCARLPPLPRERYADAAGCLCDACLRGLLDAATAGAAR